MKSMHYALMVLSLTASFIVMNGCSRIEIQKPSDEDQIITTPYTLIVKHNGCGRPDAETFRAWLDKDDPNPLDISSAFTYAGDTWTALDYNLPLGSHALTVTANVRTGSFCYASKSSDMQTFIVAQCTDFVQAWGIDFDFWPDTLSIEYGANVLNIAQGESKTISLPENSPLLIKDDKLPVTVKYGIKNITDKNLKFYVYLKHGETFLDDKNLVFCGETLVNAQHNVNISPSSGPLDIIIEAGDILESPSEDTRALFFAGKLWLRIYPL